MLRQHEIEAAEVCSTVACAERAFWQFMLESTRLLRRHSPYPNLYRTARFAYTKIIVVANFSAELDHRCQYISRTNKRQHFRGSEQIPVSQQSLSISLRCAKPTTTREIEILVRLRCPENFASCAVECTILLSALPRIPPLRIFRQFTVP